MWLYILIIVAASIVLLTIITIADKNKQSVLLIILLFLLGLQSTNIMVGMNTFFAQYILADKSIFNIFFNTLISSGFNEELVKFIVLIVFTWFCRQLVTRYDAIVYSSAISIGMSTFETIGYVLANKESMLVTAIIRIALCLTGHCVYAIVMGYFYGCSKMSISKKEYFKGICSLILALIIPIFLHTSYNTVLEIKPYANIVFFVGMVICLIGSVVICYVVKNNRPLRITEEFDKKMMPYEYKLLPKEILAIISVLAVYSILWFVYALIRGIIVVTF